MICAIHQPNFLPYIGFFDKIIKSDVFVIYDDAQFNKSDFQNKNYILLDQKKFCLRVPIQKSPLKTNINQIKINNKFKSGNLDWKEYHLLQIKNAYSKEKNFNILFPKIKEIYLKNHEYLVNLNMDFIKLICKELNINKKFIYSSQIPNLDKLRSTQRIIQICQEVKSNTYFSGGGGKNYLEENLFKEKNIQLIFQKIDFFAHEKDKINNLNLSTIDYLFKK